MSTSSQSSFTIHPNRYRHSDSTPSDEPQAAELINLSRALNEHRGQYELAMTICTFGSLQLTYVGYKGESMLTIQLTPNWYANDIYTSILLHQASVDNPSGFKHISIQPERKEDPEYLAIAVYNAIRNVPDESAPAWMQKLKDCEYKDLGFNRA